MRLRMARSLVAGPRSRNNTVYPVSSVVSEQLPAAWVVGVKSMHAEGRATKGFLWRRARFPPLGNSLTNMVVDRVRRNACQTPGEDMSCTETYVALSIDSRNSNLTSLDRTQKRDFRSLRRNE